MDIKDLRHQRRRRHKQYEPFKPEAFHISDITFLTWITERRKKLEMMRTRQQKNRGNNSTSITRDLLLIFLLFKRPFASLYQRQKRKAEWMKEKSYTCDVKKSGSGIYDWEWMRRNQDDLEGIARWFSAGNTQRFFFKNSNVKKISFSITW